MSGKAGPSIVTNGLVLSLDASDKNSYTSGSTTWYNLSGNNNGTLTNGPTFNNSNGGRLVLDGSNDYIEFSTRNINLEFQPLQPYSIFCWVYNLTGNVNGGGIVSNMVDTSPYTGWDLWVNNTTQVAAHLISSWSTNAIKIAITFDYAGNANKWVNIGYTYNGTSPANATDALNSINFYINGFLFTTGKTNDIADGFDTTSQTTTYNTSQRLRIGSRWASGVGSSIIPLTISNAIIYNRALSAVEILQNYNAVKGRFGL